MDFLKKHYEKIALSLALLALAGTALWVFSAIQQKQAEIKVSLEQTSNAKSFSPVDLAPYTAALENSRKAVAVDLGTPHVLFNPTMWKQKADGTLIRMQSSNLAEALAITNIHPLNLVINFERQAGTGFYFGVTKEAAPRAGDRKKVQRYANEGGKADLFTLKKVEPSAEAPERFILELNDSKQEVVITSTQPFQRLEGYAADLTYSVENKTFNDQRVGNVISFGGESYKIIAITENEVRVQANSNQKQTTIRLKPTP